MSAYENKLVKTKEFLYNWFKEKYGEPSFPKFVDMIIEGAAKCGEDSCSSMDVHWRPYYAACSYCDLPYNFISKVFDLHNRFTPLPPCNYTQMETVGRDMEVLFTDLLGVELPSEYHANSVSGSSVQDKTRQYLDQLDPETRTKLYAVYQHDFLLFHYAPY